MQNKERGSVAIIVTVTILFIIIILSSFLVYTSSRRRAQLEETEKISNSYDGDLEEVYNNLEERDLIKASKVASDPNTYYGVQVTGYTCTNSEAVPIWRIFYADNTNIYLISDDYIASQYVPNSAGGHAPNIGDTNYKLYLTNVYTDYTGSEWINSNSKGKKWLNQFLTQYGTSTNNNIKAVAYIMDTNIWSTFAGVDAEYAMGGPTIELFCESYKQTHPSKYVDYSVTNSNGYGVKLNTSSSYSTSVSDLPQNDFNQIYIKSDTSKARGMWLASPSSYSSSRLMDAAYYGNVGYYNYYDTGCGIRPLVCLRSDVRLKKTSDGVYAIQ